MRLLLLSDTHGDLGLINRTVAQTGAGAVIHAGDFGFYDDGSYWRLSARELGLRVTHSHLSPEEKRRLLDLPREALEAALRRTLPLSDLPRYLTRGEQFDVPVYATWGNHDDLAVVRELLAGKQAVHNLHILSPGRVFECGAFQVLGVGGNFLPGQKLLQPPFAGGGGRAWATLADYERAVEAADAARSGMTRIFVSHVSPGKEPFVEQVAYRVGARLTVSGHMSPPTAMVWNAFAISTLDEAIARLGAGVTKVREACRAAAHEPRESLDTRFEAVCGPGPHIPNSQDPSSEPRWYRGCVHVNLPDAGVGYAVIEERGGRLLVATGVTGTPGS